MKQNTLTKSLMRFRKRIRNSSEALRNPKNEASEISSTSWKISSAKVAAGELMPSIGWGDVLDDRERRLIEEARLTRDKDLK
uniref:Uncharacterized protein n=1 Tax=Romanomermis culicivorax TaxID=13658 RepID=A0A915JEV6_ROMCU